MRRKDKMTSNERALQTVDTCLYADLGLCTKDNMPYVVPVSIVRDRDKIYFHSANEGKKLDIINENPNVCLSMVESAANKEREFSVNYVSAIVFGKAQIVEDEDEKNKALYILSKRHIPKGMDKFDDEMKKHAKHCTVVRIKIEKITGKHDER